MGTASIHEGVGRMRFSSLLDRQERGEITQEEAAEMRGCMRARSSAGRRVTRMRAKRDLPIGGWAGDRRADLA
jgi:hypothetical protein